MILCLLEFLEKERQDKKRGIWSFYKIRSLTPIDMVFLPDEHSLKWFNLNPKIDKIKLA